MHHHRFAFKKDMETILNIQITRGAPVPSITSLVCTRIFLILMLNVCMLIICEFSTFICQYLMGSTESAKSVRRSKSDGAEEGESSQKEPRYRVVYAHSDYPLFGRIDGNSERDSEVRWVKSDDEERGSGDEESDYDDEESDCDDEENEFGDSATADVGLCTTMPYKKVNLNDLTDDSKDIGDDDDADADADDDDAGTNSALSVELSDPIPVPDVDETMNAHLNSVLPIGELGMTELKKLNKKRLVEYATSVLKIKVGSSTKSKIIDAIMLNSGK